MASRWRVWSGEAHVDSYPKEVEKERAVQERLKFIPVDHSHSWEEFHEFIKNRTHSLSPYLNELINKDKSVASSSGLGRAQLLTCYVDRPAKRPGGLAQPREHTTTDDDG
uniref:Uncharacterized protein n=1 Tax=Amphimedon queenslandica TaxID=400682 RepID=I1F0S6_AMPQE